jgi:signal transduction histidine kinase
MFVCVVAVWLVAASVPSDQAFGRGLVELLIVGTPIAAGLYVLRSGANRRFGRALILIGFAWSVTALTESSHSIPFTVGRMSTWLILPCTIFLLIAFPSGHITNGFDRVVFWGFVGVSAFLFVGTAPLVHAFPPKTLWATCTTNCPANAVFILHQQPGFLTQLILAREWLIELLWLGVFWSMFRRWRAASELQRRAMAPVFVAGALLGLFQIAHVSYRQLGGSTNTVVALSSAWTLCIVALCATFPLASFWHRRLLGDALTALGPALGKSDSPAEMRDALAVALHDPSLELLFREPDSDGWHDAHERPRSWPQPLPVGRAATRTGAVDRAGGLILVHDAALCDDQELLDGVAGVVLAVKRHEQLITDLEHAMSDLEKSRRRIAEAADHERARIERDLHDGAQQRLVALRIKLSLVAQRLQTDPGAARAEIDELGSQTDLAIDELRSLAHGVYPPLLADFGVAGALRELTLHNALPIRVAASGTSRYPMEVESAVYFTCVEAVQNAMKHATGATAVWIELTESRGTLHFEVRDDGKGMPPHARSGQGMRNMHDRLEALSGRLTITSQPGRGTRVVASLPLLVTDHQARLEG